MSEDQFADLTGIDYGSIISTNLVRFFVEGRRD